MQMKWDVFTLEERKMIEDLMSKRAFDMIPKAIMMDSMEKEYWIQQLLDENKPVGAPIDSKVEKELNEARMRGNEITTPEQEKEWQEKLDAEKKEHAEKVKAKRGRPAKVKVEETK